MFFSQKIKSLLLSVALIVLPITIGTCTVTAAETEPLVKTEAPVKMIREMLYPTVMIDTGRGGVGSGTVIFSDRRAHESWEDEGVWSLVITNFHVIQNAVSINKEFDPKQGMEIQKETRRPVHVRLWDYNDFSTAVGTTGRIGRIVAWDKGRDLALLRLDDKERVIEHVAALWDEKGGGPYLFQTTWAIGSGLGNPPYPTQGLLSGIAGKDLQGRPLYLSSTPIIFGNSGGSLWAFSTRRDTYEMIGVPSMISGYGWGKIVPHMAWSRPISEIRIFLRDNNFGFVFGDKDVPKENEFEEENIE
jgi:S1-C subfamily serine protease